MTAVSRIVPEVIWEDPPPKRESGPLTKWSRLLAEMFKHPGKWAFLGEFEDGNSSSARAHYVKGIARRKYRGTWEFVTRSTGDDYYSTRRLYGRYVGPEA